MPICRLRRCPDILRSSRKSTDPYLVSQDESMDYGGDEEFETPRRKKGFFERIFGSSDESRAEKRRKRQSKNDNNSIY